jgi:APA family basic amino acid/polyamine antiporter
MATLARILTLRDLTFLLMGSVIGSGIFLVPGQALNQVGRSVELALTAWLVGGVVMLLGALTLGELSAANPAAGGQYVFLRDCFGPLPAFLFGWTVFFVINAGAIAALSVAFSTTLAAFLKDSFPLSPLAQKLVSIGVITVLTIVNVRGTRQSANLQNYTTAIKVGAILLMSLVMLSLGRGFADGGEVAAPAASSLPPFSAFGIALIGVLWAYDGWQPVACSAGETLHPQRTFPRAFLLGALALITVYLLANVAYLAALGPAGLAETESAAPAALGAVLGPWASHLITLVILISVFSAANSNFLTRPRVFFAMANDGLFFRRLAAVHPRFGTPAFAVVANAPIAAVMAATGTFEQLLTYVIFVGLIFDALSAACVFVYRRRASGAARPYSVPGYPWTPSLFILAAIAIMANTLATQPREAAIGLGLVVVGLPAYFVWRSRRN